jgi:alpha-1,2-mannosyltransferase
MTWWMKFDQFLNLRRMRYAWIAGVVLWSMWLLSSILGLGNMDMAGQVIGTDYLQFYASGVTLRQEQSANLYEFAFQSQLEQTIAGPGLSSYHAFITPPFLAWLFVPLSVLPYIFSFILWCLLGFLFLWKSIRLLSIERPFNVFLLSLTWFPIFAAISFGQNSLLSLLLFSLTFWLWRKGKLISAGLVCSLLLFKPQMVLGIGILWLLEWRRNWKSLLGFLIGGGGLVGLCIWFMPEASKAYLKLVRDFFPNLIYADQFPLWHLHSLRGFWTLLLPGKKLLVEGLSLLLSLAGVVAYYFYWRKNRKQPELLFAAAICLTIWITPHAMIYDWSILLIPAILFWQARPGLNNLWKPMFALIWMVTFVSGPLTYAQLQILPIAIQISIPVLFFVYLTIGKFINSKEKQQGELQSTLD